MNLNDVHRPLGHTNVKALLETAEPALWYQADRHATNESAVLRWPCGGEGERKCVCKRSQSSSFTRSASSRRNLFRRVFPGSGAAAHPSAQSRLSSAASFGKDYTAASSRGDRTFFFLRDKSCPLPSCARSARGTPPPSRSWTFTHGGGGLRGWVMTDNGVPRVGQRELSWGAGGWMCASRGKGAHGGRRMGPRATVEWSGGSCWFFGASAAFFYWGSRNAPPGVACFPTRTLSFPAACPEAQHGRTAAPASSMTAEVSKVNTRLVEEKMRGVRGGREKAGAVP